MPIILDWHLSIKIFSYLQNSESCMAEKKMFSLLLLWASLTHQGLFLGKQDLKVCMKNIELLRFCGAFEDAFALQMESFYFWPRLFVTCVCSTVLSFAEKQTLSQMNAEQSSGSRREAQATTSSLDDGKVAKAHRQHEVYFSPLLTCYYLDI